MAKTYYIRFPDDIESKIETEKQIAEKKSGVEAKMNSVILSVLWRGIRSLELSRKRSGQ
jgi:hypothetical protein